MIKTHDGSRFTLKTLEEIRDASDVILQIQKTESTFTGTGKTVYLCEVVGAYEYSKTKNAAERLAAEIERVNADNRTLRRKIDRLTKELEKERAKP